MATDNPYRELEAAELRLRRQVADLQDIVEAQRIRIARLEAAYRVHLEGLQRVHLEGLQQAGGMIQARDGDEASRKRCALITETVLAGRRAMAGIG